MIRPARMEDRDAMLAAIVASGLFDDDGIATIAPMLDAFLGGTAGPGDTWLAVERDGKVCGAAFYQPEPLTDGTWNLQLIAVRTDAHRSGIGRALLRYVEADLSAHGGRILLIETSGLAAFEGTRRFYRACDYNDEARIRDFYATGEDKIVFLKRLVR